MAWIIVAILLLNAQIRHLSHGPQSVTSQMLTNLVNRENAVVIDIRGQADFNKGHIHGAINVPLSQIKNGTKDLEKHFDKPIIMVCNNGIQVNGGCEILRKSGAEKLYKLVGGMSSWTGENLPVVKS
ncbi:MAG: rhodanese-like domain-containing protein [Gammaproteobacteria bacterium]|nr:rhodanese-like domain-containing protein [Gammaproteobacteria bacterium]